jgi:hypothetical protein|tara:strand:- start:6456 stop:7991 length:1536 start_codon:yes stop_codon:yes gene_type:complete
MAENTVSLFGFEIKRKKQGDKDSERIKSVVAPQNDDGAGYVTASGSHFGQYVDIDGDNTKDNIAMINKYRGIAVHPEVDMAIEDIVNEAIVNNSDESTLSLNTDDIEAPDNIKKIVQEEFKNVLSMFDASEHAHDLFKRWYIDGRIYHHILVDEKNEKAGIQELRFIDATKIRKIKEVKTKKDPNTNADVIESINEYFIYTEKPGKTSSGQIQNKGVKFTLDSINYVTSGLLDESRKKVVSHLHKCIKPVNQLRMMEDSLVIYRLSRAPERRIFYVDVGNLPKGKAEEYMKNIMTKYRNKLVYDAGTGELRDDRKHMSMLEDFWLPRREGGRGTEVTTLPGGDNLGQIDDIIYFQKRLYRSLNVPLNRLEQESQFSLGKNNEITREEVKFSKFIDRLRKKFSMIFLQVLKKQLVLKKIITEADWDVWKTTIRVDYARDNYFSELKDAEILRERLQTLDIMSQYVGDYFSKEWVFKNVLKYSEEDIKDLKSQVEDEIKSGEVADPATAEEED